MADAMKTEYEAIHQAGFCCRSTVPISAPRATTSIRSCPMTRF
jgi:hypothetical protein